MGERSAIGSWRTQLPLLAVPALFYGFTTAPGIAHADQAILIEAMCEGRLGAGATHHNLTVLLGYLFGHYLPLGSLEFRCNLVSTSLAACAVWLFHLVVRRITGSGALGAMSAASLMTSHSMWWHATVAEVYAANALICVGVLSCLVAFEEGGNWSWMYASAAVAAFGVFNHAQMGMWLPGLVLLAAWRAGPGPVARVRAVARLALWYAVGLVPYGLVFLADVTRSRGLTRAAQEAVGGEFTGLFFTISAAGARDTAQLFLMQWGWPPLFLVIIIFGAWRLGRRPDRRATALVAGVAFVVNTGFFAFYPTWDKYAFLLPSFLLATFAGAIGLEALWFEHARTRAARILLGLFAVASAAAPVGFFRILPSLATQGMWSRYGVHEATRLTMTDGEYLANPDKHGYRSVERYVRLAFERLPHDAMIVDHISRTFFQFRHYQRRYGMRPDLHFVVFVPAGLEVSRWPNGAGRPEVVEMIAGALPTRRVFATSLWLGGFADAVSDLMDRGITMVEEPWGDVGDVFEARPSVDVPMRSWLEEARVGLDLDRPAASLACCHFGRVESERLGVLLRLRRRNPPAPARVDWVEVGTGSSIPGRAHKLAFDVPPVLIRPPGPLGPGQWIARIYLFDQEVASRPFSIE